MKITFALPAPATVKEFEENFANKGDRVCVTLSGQALDMQSALVSGENIDLIDKIPSQDYLLIRSSERVSCVDLLK